MTFSSSDGLEAQKQSVVSGGNSARVYTKEIGQVDLVKEAQQAAKLGQKIDGADDKNSKKSGPSQAQLSNKLFLYYLQGSRGKCGLILAIVLLAVISIVSQAVRTYTDYLFVLWGEDASRAVPNHTQSYWLSTTMYGLLGSFGLFLVQIVVFVYCAIDASQYIHFESVRTIFHSTISFLDQTPTGTLINYLSKDVEVVDTTLPSSFLYVIQQAIRLTTVFLLAAISSPFLLIPFIPVVLVIWYLRIGFHNTSVQVKRIEASQLQPIFALFASVLKGGPTIRAYQLQDQFNTRFQALVDRYVRVKIIGQQLERRFGFYLNSIVAGYITLLAVGVCLLRSWIDPDLAMLAVTTSLSLGTLQATIRFYTLVKSSMTSVHRLHELKSIPLEADFNTNNIIRELLSSQQPTEFRSYQLWEEKEIQKTKKLKNPPKKTKDGQAINIDYRTKQQHSLSFWPWYGCIEFRGLTLKYRPDLPIVINALNFTVRPGQFVGVCGKTGAGKSTLFQAMARLIKPRDKGSIMIDGVDIEDVGVGDVRGRAFSLIPQSPYLFSGTVRHNLDPLTRFTDVEIWYSLKLVSMDDVVKQRVGGLYSAVNEGGSNFSASQRQLLCIARALSQPNVLIEANRIADGRGVDQLTSSNGQTKGAKANKTVTKKDNHHHDPYWNFHDDTASREGEYTSISLDYGQNDPSSTTTTSTSPQMSPPAQGSILLCDEITSSTDINADNLIQHTIRHAFAESTVMIIAHRLSTIVDLDRILVLRALTENDIANNVTSLLEYDVPFVLLNDHKSAFFQMCTQTGLQNFMFLYEIAKKAFYVTQDKEFRRWGTRIEYPRVEIVTQPGFEEMFESILNNSHNSHNGGHDDLIATPLQSSSSASSSSSSSSSSSPSHSPRQIGTTINNNSNLNSTPTGTPKFKPKVVGMDGTNSVGSTQSSMTQTHNNVDQNGPHLVFENGPHIVDNNTNNGPNLFLDPYALTQTDVTTIYEESLKSPDALTGGLSGGMGDEYRAQIENNLVQQGRKFPSNPTKSDIDGEDGADGQNE